ncbi:MAG: Zn-dependent hydrolase [Rhodospirillales bacterium]
MNREKNLKINGQRLWDSLMEMAKIGATEKGGNCRLALTDLDREARDLFVSWCEAAGCTVKIDQMGNIFARRAGRDNALAPVMTGSHLDTQPTGGRFDGVFGVLAGLEIVRTLNDLGLETEHPVEIAVWTNEEGSRFAPAMVSSGVFAGVFDLEYGLSRTDEDGKTIGEELARIGYAGAEPVGGRPVHAFFEAHIEQGPVLEEEDIPIGAVTHGQGQYWFELTFTGAESHAGPTPMDRRKDALLGAARMIERVNAIGHEHAPQACATVGMVNVHPNSRNVIPGRVFMTVDIRHPLAETLDDMAAKVRESARAIADKTNIAAALEQILHYPPVPFDESCVNAVREAARDCGFEPRDIVSGAGHDACYIAKTAPTAMIFVPCIGGVSHTEIEDAKPEWITAGADVLLRAMLKKAGHAEDAR